MKLGCPLLAERPALKMTIKVGQRPPDDWESLETPSRDASRHQNASLREHTGERCRSLHGIQDVEDKRANDKRDCGDNFALG